MRGLLYGGFIFFFSRITTLSRLSTVGLWELLTPKEREEMENKKEVEIQWVDLFGNPIKKDTYDLTENKRENNEKN